MKKLRLALLAVTFVFAAGFSVHEKQNTLSGFYADSFCSTIQLNPDSTFTYKWHFDLMYSWNKGTWRTVNDTIFLKIIPLYDTLTPVPGMMQHPEDSLFLSIDTIPQRFDKPLCGVGYSGGQGLHEAPLKLIYLNGRLYLLTFDNKPDKNSKYKFSGNAYPTYYERK